jgi:hypothetical protein
VNEVGRAYGTHGGREIVYKVFMGKPEGKRPLGIPKRRWEDGIRMDLIYIVWGVWIGFNWLRIGTLAGCCEYGDES